MGTESSAVTVWKRLCKQLGLALKAACCGVAAWRLCAGLVLTGVAAALSANAQNFTASLDRDTIPLGESATLSLTFEGGSPKDVPGLPALPNVHVTYGGQSSQFSFVNGRTTSSVSYNFSLTPTRPGDVDIPAIRVEVGGKVLSSRPLKLRVLKPDAPPPDEAALASQIAFMRLVLPKKEVFVGEVIKAEIQFYFRQGIQLAGQPGFTALPVEGFAVGKAIDLPQRRAQIGNAVYVVLPYAVALTAVKTGELTVGPVTAKAVIQLPSQNRRRDPFFERFGLRDPFADFFGVEQKQVSLATDTETVQSHPLPAENVPPNFNGAVGNYELGVSVGPTNVAVGDPITVRVEISGRGALDLLTLPEQSAWRDFKSFSATTKTDTTDALGIQGVKTFEQVLLPQSADIKELPPVVFSFFDPETKSYRTLTHPAVPLTVRPTGPTPLPTVASTAGRANEPPAQDIVPIKQRLGAVAQIRPPLVQQPWFLGLQAAPVLAWLGLLAWRKRTDALANNPRLRRQRQVARIIREGLQRLHQLAAENNSEEFFATLFRLLQEQVGERLDLPASSITEAVIEEQLRPRNAPAAMLEMLHDLFEMCNAARYAPMKSSRELAAVIPKLESVLEELRRWNP